MGGAARSARAGWERLASGTPRTSMAVGGRTQRMAAGGGGSRVAQGGGIGAVGVIGEDHGGARAGGPALGDEREEGAGGVERAQARAGGDDGAGRARAVGERELALDGALGAEDGRAALLAVGQVV